VGAVAYRSADARVIAATQRDIDADVAGGRFRRDLYHRLAVLRIALPPLRDRREDLPHLVRRFVDELRPGGGVEVPADAIALLGDYDWPGNVRELRNTVARALALAPEARRLSADLLGLAPPDSAGPPAQGPELPFRESKERLLGAWEREYLAGLLRRTGGNVSEAARRSGIDRGHLHHLLKKHALVP
jgi:DNA-binding NtrC family response regulator